MTNNSHDISDAIYDIRQSITDKQYENLMKLLSVKHEKDEKDEKVWFNYTYFKQTNKLEQIDSDIVRRLVLKRKTKKVYIKKEDTNTGTGTELFARVGLFQKHIESFGQEGMNHEYGHYLYKDTDGDFCLDLQSHYTTKHLAWFNNPYIEQVKPDEDSDDEDYTKKQEYLKREYGVYVEYLQHIPISLTKI